MKQEGAGRIASHDPGLQGSIVRRVYGAQFVGAIVDGYVLTTAALYFTIHVGLDAGFVGLVLGAGALVSLLIAPFLGSATDRIGLGRSACAYSIVNALALALYAIAGSESGYTAAAPLFLVSQAGLAAARQALVAAHVSAEERVPARARMQTLLNAGMGLGAVLGAVVLALGSRQAFLIGFALGALVMLCCAVAFARLPRDESDRVTPTSRPSAGALRDRRLLAVTGLAALLQLTMPILSVILPIWIAERTNAPTWVSAVLLGINTVLVMCLQTTVAAHARSAKSAARTAILAAACLAIACILIGISAMTALTPVAASLLLVMALLPLTLGEMSAGAASWQAAFAVVPRGAEGQYQAVFGMASSGARILGPAAALPLVLHTGPAAWAVLATVTATAAITLGALIRREAALRSSKPTQGLPANTIEPG